MTKEEALETIVSGRFDEMIEALGDLYSPETGDWELAVSHTLTEPTCPTAVVQPEGMQCTIYRFDRDTVWQAMVEAVTAAYQEQVLGIRLNLGLPWSNPDDTKLPRPPADGTPSGTDVPA